MSKLTTKQRNKLSESDFAGPDRSFPVNDKEHARKALQMAPKSYNAGNISKNTEESIEAKARAKLGKRIKTK